MIFLITAAMGWFAGILGYEAASWLQLIPREEYAIITIGIPVGLLVATIAVTWFWVWSSGKPD